jgi:hypothetical protein
LPGQIQEASTSAIVSSATWRAAQRLPMPKLPALRGHHMATIGVSFWLGLTLAPAVRLTPRPAPRR